MKCIAVFCGSSTGTNGIYKDQAENLGKTLAKNNIQVVYGGGKVRLMGILANAALGSVRASPEASWATECEWLLCSRCI